MKPAVAADARSAAPDGLPLLLELATLARSRDDLRVLWEQVAGTMARTLEFETVVVNEYRPAWDDFQAVVAIGLAESDMATLMGGTVSRALLRLGLEKGHKIHDAYIVSHDEADLSEFVSASVAGRGEGGDPERWHPEDSLFVPLMARTGRPLALLSLDNPIGGRRPDDAKLAAVSALSSVVTPVVEHAQIATKDARHRRAVEHLLRVSSELRSGLGLEEILGVVCRAVRDALDFESVAVLVEDEVVDRFEVLANVGFEPRTRRPVSRADLESMLSLVPGQEGCVLIDDRTATAAAAEIDFPIFHHSRNNGRGEAAWDHHRLYVPLRDRDGRLLGMLRADDPVDHLLPEVDDLRALRAFADHAVTAIETAATLARFRRLSERDPLTGLYNRRGLEGLSVEPGLPASALVFDLDRFKRINDTLGHTAGDDVLRRFSTLLEEEADETGRAARLGGEEFALLLPRTDRGRALDAAERIRRRLKEIYAGGPVPVTVSAGVATAAVEEERPDLLRHATRALHAAKHLGRDRCIAYDRGSLELLEAVAEERPDEQIAAAVLLAETLDLRDPATAEHSKTVGTLAERLAVELGLPGDQVERVRVAGLVHDIGKIGISDEILLKPGRLTAEEFAEIERHPEIGARLLEHANLAGIADWVLGHHERIDGHGYPRALAGDQIPIESRILAVADAYEAMVADRPYRAGLGAEAAMAELERCAGTQFDGEVVAALMTVLRASAARVTRRVGPPAALGSQAARPRGAGATNREASFPGRMRGRRAAVGDQQ